MSLKTQRFSAAFAVIVLSASLAAPAARADTQSNLKKAEDKAAKFFNNAAHTAASWATSASKRIDKIKETGRELTNFNRKAEKHVATGTDQIVKDLNNAGN